MSYSSLIDAFTLALCTVGDGLANPTRADWANFSINEIAPFAQALADTPQVNSIWGRWAVTPGSGSRLDAESAARYFISRARAGYSAEAIIADLVRFAATGEVHFHSVRAITNVEVRERVEVGSNVALVPPSALPPGNCRNVAFHNGLSMGETNRVLPGLTALVVTTKLSTLRDPPPPQIIGQVPMLMPITIDPKVQTEIESAFMRSRIALVAAGGAAPNFGASYGYVSSLGWPSMSENGVGAGMLVPPPNPCISSDHTSAMQHVYDIAGSPDETILLAIDHLAAARNRQSDAERAIEIGACFEILLMHGQNSDNAEITNKISHRGAWLIGTDSDDRLRVYKTIKAAYSFRSKAVHAGKLPAIKHMDEQDARQRFFIECETIIGKLIERLLSGWPTRWDDVTLSING